MLTGAVLAAVLLTASSAAGAAPAVARVVYGLETRDVGPGTTVSLVRLDATTLKERARLDLGEGAGYRSAPFAWSPNKRRLVVATETRIRLIDTASLQESGQVPLAENPVSFLNWPSPRVVVALVGVELWRIDPDTAAIIQRIPFRRTIWDAGVAGDRSLFLTGAGGAFPCCRGSTLFLSRLSRGGRLRTASLSVLRTGLEPWRARRDALLPPRAEQALELARAEFARDRGVPETAVEVLGLTPARRLFCGFAGGGAGYVVKLGAQGAYAIYSVTIVRVPESSQSPPYVCRKTRLSVRPAPTQYDLLRSRPGSWDVPDVALVVDAAQRRAVVVTSTGPLAEVELRTMRVRYHVLRRPLGTAPPEAIFSWFSDRPVRIADRIAVSAGRYLRLVDARRFSVRTLTPAGSSSCSLAAEGANLYLYGHSSCYGVTALDRRGRIRFGPGDPSETYDLQVTGRYAYALGVERDRAQLYVIAARHGRLVRVVDAPSELTLLLPPPRLVGYGD